MLEAFSTMGLIGLLRQPQRTKKYRGKPIEGDWDERQRERAATPVSSIPRLWGGNQ